LVDPAVKKRRWRGLQFIMVDITKNTDDDKALLREYELMGTPNISSSIRRINF